ncbi:MAG: type I DNA topoisomerase [Eubacteriales bacterium]
MAKNLVIIESPSKIHTIQACLGSNYKILASKGHVRDLPKSTFAIDIENDFAPRYINIRGKGDLIKDLKKEAKAAKTVYLATDPDREGEAISWHLAAALEIPEDKLKRVTFNEITKTAIKASIKQPRAIDINLVNAQQSRRILDRIVGYKLSPLLWKRVRHGLSAGRVQSVATRLVVEREEEIRAFVPEEYWTVAAKLDASGSILEVRYFGDAATGNKVRLTNEAEAKAVVDAVLGKSMKVQSVKHGVKYKAPAPPFTTSTMLQDAARKLGFQSARTMKTAQELYEGINLGAQNGGAQGIITYMRTDSLRIAAEAQAAARDFINEKYGDAFYPATPRVYKTKANAQDAHEAIRPARVDLVPAQIKSYLTSDQFKLYKLIWERFVASQMESAKLDTLGIDFESSGHLFRTGGYTVAFQGYMAVYEEGVDEAVKKADDPDDIKNFKIPNIEEGSSLPCVDVSAAKHFTEPPARYNEASLIKALEEKGIGRPSTIPPTITTILTRGYVRREGKALCPTELGEVTTALMKEDFADIVDYKFTANMENDLDRIEAGEVNMVDVLREFWEGFERELTEAEKKSGADATPAIVEQTDIICDKCGAKMIVKSGRFGKFAACPNYPECKNTKPLDSADRAEKKPAVVADFKCEVCGGDMVLRHGKYGSFYACANYPKCKFIKQEKNKLEGVSCPKCGGDILIRHGRNKSQFYSCERYPECDWSSWDLPVAEKCPECGEMLYKKKSRPGILICKTKDCGFTQTDPAAEESVHFATANDVLPENPLSPLDMPPPPGDDDIPF